MTYYRVETFGLGDVDGGSWEADVIVSGPTPQDAFNAALEHIKKQGFAFETTIKVCDHRGDEKA